MKSNDGTIALNFLEVTPRTFDVTFYRKKLAQIPQEQHKNYYQKNLKEIDASEKTDKFAIVFDEQNGFEKKIVSCSFDIDLTKRYLFEALNKQLKKAGTETHPINKDKYRRIYLPLKTWDEGIETIWIEPYFLDQINSYGFLIDFKFWVNPDYQEKIKASVDKRILQLSGSLDSKNANYPNKAFYQFKFEKLKIFFHQYLPQFKEFSSDGNKFSIRETLTELEAFSLNTKVYQFFDEKESVSPFFGLQKNPPFQKPNEQTNFLFVFKETDRSFAIKLWNGLIGKDSPNTFSGIEKMFRIPFNNSCIKGKKVNEFTAEVLNEIADEIASDREAGINTLPIFITKSKTTDEDDKLYYTIKHSFTERNIPCQVITKDLILNNNSLKYSLSNIALQIFAKAGGKPWKVKPAIKQCLIIGIGSKNKEVFITDEYGNKKKKIEKFLTYSVLTDSSGLFKEIQILSETDNEEDYYKSLVSKLKTIILQAAADGDKDIVVHSPFRISKAKVWDKLFIDLPDGLNISVLIINDEHKYFGYDLSKNALVPYESSFVSLSKYEYLVWFEGLQYNNTTFSKRIGSPVYINFWHSNNRSLLNDSSYRKNLLQDCINLSGANWRGFKAKQLPVSIFYCQRIAEFLKKFDDYGFGHIELENFKPWFL